MTALHQTDRFTPNDLARVSASPSMFQECIELEDGGAQAVHLHAETYGTDA